MASTTTITGFAEVNKALEEFGKNESKKLFRKVARAVAKEVLVKAKEGAPHETGLLERSLTVRAAKLRRRSGDVGASVTTREGLFSGDTFYGGFQEFGWIMRNGQYNPGRPFLRPAIYDHKAQWRRLASKEAKALLPEHVKAARSRARA